MKDYRPDITKKLKKILLTKESFRIKSKTGLGKSKYLRNIVKNPEFITTFLNPNKTKIYYIDCNRFYTKKTEQFIDLLGHTLGIENPRLRDIEKYIEQANKTFYIILDESQILAEMESSVANILSNLLASFKNIFNIILVAKDFNYLERDEFAYIKKQTVLTITFTPQSLEKITETITEFSKRYNIQLKPEQIEYLAKNSQGSPLIVKQTFLKMLEGLTLEDALKQKDIDIDSKKYLNFKKKQGKIKEALKEYQKELTRSEYLFLERLLLNRGSVVTRDNLAFVLSPQSEGNGVSNEAIDQIISRLRKSLKRMGKNLEIKNKRGVGYFIE